MQKKNPCMFSLWWYSEMRAWMLFWFVWFLCGWGGLFEEVILESVNQWNTTYLTRIVKLSVMLFCDTKGRAVLRPLTGGRGDGQRTGKNVKLGNETTDVSWARNSQDADQTCFLSSVHGRTDSDMREQGWQQGGGRVPPIGRTNTLHF